MLIRPSRRRDTPTLHTRRYLARYRGWFVGYRDRLVERAYAEGVQTGRAVADTAARCICGQPLADHRPPDPEWHYRERGQA